jgi:hypothetical protein
VTWKHKRGEGPIDPREKMAFNPDNPGVRWNYYYPSDEEMSGEDEPERDETERDFSSDDGITDTQPTMPLPTE